MDFTYINNNNIKVSISKDELENAGLDVDTLDYKTACSRLFVREILEKAYERIGFDAGGYGICVRVFLSLDGGCELFITKKEPYTDRDDTSGFVLKTHDTEALIQACKRLKASGYRGASELFFEKGSFILKCNTKQKLPSYISKDLNLKKGYSDFSFVCEYGNYLTLTDEMYAYLCEHCERVCPEKAVEKLSI